MTMMGETSIPRPLSGSHLRIGAITGSVARYRNITIGLYGSGFTQEISARATIIHMYKVRPISMILTNAVIKFPIINMKAPSDRRC